MEQEIKFRERIGFATAKTNNLKGWPKGEQKQVYVSKMSTGKLAIYKGARHFKEESGYKVYPTLNDLEKYFFIEMIQEQVQ